MCRLPVLLDAAGVFGRIIAIMFFLCLVCAALSSGIAMLEMMAHAIDDFDGDY
jgi:SNF family Na+-dependent transporter